MASLPFPEAPEGSSVVDLQFNHLTAYGRLSFTHLNPDGGTVQSVVLTATAPFVGDWYWKCTSGHELIDYGASSTLTVHTHLTEGIWFACAPVDMSGQKMEVTVHTDKGSYYRMIDFPANRKFESGRAAVFTVDMAEAEFTASPSADTPFTLVTDASELRIRDEVLIVYKGGSKAMGASASDYREAVNVTISENAIASAGTATVFTLGPGFSDGTWAFRDGSDYLTSPVSNNNYLLNSTAVTANSSWTVRVTSGGIATITAVAGGRTVLSYYLSSSRFVCYYTSSDASMPMPSIYRRSGVLR